MLEEKRKALAWIYYGFHLFLVFLFIIINLIIENSFTFVVILIIMLILLALFNSLFKIYLIYLGFKKQECLYTEKGFRPRFTKVVTGNEAIFAAKKYFNSLMYFLFSLAVLTFTIIKLLL